MEQRVKFLFKKKIEKLKESKILPSLKIFNNLIFFHYNFQRFIIKQVRAIFIYKFNKKNTANIIKIIKKCFIYIVKIFFIKLILNKIKKLIEKK